MDKKSWLGKATPDIESARPLYEQAALHFKGAKAFHLAVEAHQKAAFCYSQQGAAYLSAKQIELAALLLQKDPKEATQAADLFNEASRAFSMYGSGEKAAECQEKAAKCVEDSNPDLAIKYYTEACSIYEGEEKQRGGIDTMGRFVSFLVKHKRWALAMDQSTRIVQLWRKLDNHPSYNKQALTTTLIVLMGGDSVEARKRLVNFEEFQGFYDSEEGEICNILVESYETYDEEMLANVLKRPIVRYLDNEIAKAAMALRIPGSGGPRAPQPQPHHPQQQQQMYSPPQGFQQQPVMHQFNAPQGFQPSPFAAAPQGFQQPPPANPIQQQQQGGGFQPPPRGSASRQQSPTVGSPSGSQRSLGGSAGYVSPNNGSRANLAQAGGAPQQQGYPVPQQQQQGYVAPMGTGGAFAGVAEDDDDLC
ncbi:hypothetical protein HDU98_002479 [Podochytrium sp. JEL0797]|nr:hypothetical protein HDU98_002479 [Podochytrium sp. JEL0797]